MKTWADFEVGKLYCHPLLPLDIRVGAKVVATVPAGKFFMLFAPIEEMTFDMKDRETGEVTRRRQAVLIAALYGEERGMIVEYPDSFGPSEFIKGEEG